MHYTQPVSLSFDGNLSRNDALNNVILAQVCFGNTVFLFLVFSLVRV